MSDITVSLDGGRVVEIVENGTKVLEVNLGTRGPAGADGADGSGLYSITAAIALGGHRAITWSGEYLTQTNLNEYAGVTLGAVSVGGSAQAQRLGVLSDNSFSFTAGLPVYALSSGVLVQTYTSLPVRRLGIAKTTTSIELDPQPTIG